MTNRSWNGAMYDRVSGPMEALGRATLDRLPLAGGETVLDAGCGSGRVTEALIERLPSGHVIAVDGSPSMVARARERLGPRAQVIESDLLELELPEPVDHVLSTATFHWIADHERLFARLRTLLREGGWLVAQCGGEGNINGLRSVAERVGAEPPYAEHFAGWRGPWHYAAPAITEQRLRAAGFREARCWLQPAPVTPEEPRDYLATIVLGAHVERLPDALVGRYLDDVLVALGEPLLVDYVRLNIDAVA